MARSLALLTLLAAVVSSRAPAQDLVGPTWAPLSFSVTKPAGGANPAQAREQGTEVVTLLEVPGRKIIKIEQSKSTAESFTDDRGTDLLAGARLGFNPRSQVVFVGRGQFDRPPNQVTFKTLGHPARGATKVRIKGSVTVVLGKGEKEVEKKDADLKAGIDVGFGTLKLPDKKGFGAATNPISYQGTRPLASVTLTDGDGKEIQCRVDPSWSLVAADKAPYRAAITVADKDKKVERCTVRVKYFDAVEEVKVPFDLEVGPGL